jgi:hypothetical protein
MRIVSLSVKNHRLQSTGQYLVEKDVFAVTGGIGGCKILQNALGTNAVFSTQLAPKLLSD